MNASLEPVSSAEPDDPSLRHLPTGVVEAYRLTLIEIGGGGRVVMASRRVEEVPWLAGLRYDSWSLVVHWLHERTVTRIARMELRGFQGPCLRELVDLAGFWSLRPRLLVAAFDSSESILEGNDGQRFHAVQRYCLDRKEDGGRLGLPCQYLMDLSDLAAAATGAAAEIGGPPPSPEDRSA